MTRFGADLLPLAVPADLQEETAAIHSTEPAPGVVDADQSCRSQDMTQVEVVRAGSAAAVMIVQDMAGRLRLTEGMIVGTLGADLAVEEGSFGVEAAHRSDSVGESCVCGDPSRRIWDERVLGRLLP